MNDLSPEAPSAEDTVGGKSGVARKSVLIAVTGAQGVGKSTFCRKLSEALTLSSTDIPVYLLDGLGQSVRSRGYDVGSLATAAGVGAVMEAHAARQRSMPIGYVVADRCGVDALAYVRHLGVLSKHEIETYEEQARVLIAPISLALHLITSQTFAVGAAHETPELRAAVGAEIPLIIADFSLAVLSLDAAAPDSLARALDAIMDLATTA